MFKVMRKSLLAVMILSFLIGCSAPAVESGVEFQEVSFQAFGKEDNSLFTFSVSCADINRDGWTDIYFNNHHVRPGKFFINDGSETFSDVWEYSGIRETSWVSRIFSRPLFSPADFGVFIWHDPDYSRNWKIRWTGGADRHHFSGKICLALPKAARDSNINGKSVWKKDEFLMKVPTIIGDRVNVTQDENGCINFDSFCSDKIKGLDLNAEALSNGLIVEIKIDGKNQPEILCVGGDKDHPSESPFQLWLGDRHACVWGGL